MKKTAKWLSLLLAGALLASTIASCSENDGDEPAQTTTDGQAVTTTDTPEPPTTDVQPPNGRYSPEWLYQKVLKDETVRIWVDYSEKVGEDEVASYSYVLVRDRDLVRVDRDEFSGDEIISTITYYDLGERVRYTADGEGWVEEPIDDTLDWKGIVEAALSDQGEYWLDTALIDDNYLFEGEEVWMKDALLETVKASLAPDAANAAGIMFEQAGNYFISLNASDPNRSSTAEFAAYFAQYHPVELPEVSEKPVDEPVDQPPSDDPAPTEPDFTPSELYAALLDPQDLFLSAKQSSSQNNASEIVTRYAMKSGDKVELHDVKQLFEGTTVTEKSETVTYYDLASGTTYYADGDGWRTQSESVTWTDIVDHIFAGEAYWTEVLLSDASYLSNGEGGYAMTEDALKTLFGSEEGYEASGSILEAIGGESYWFHIANGNGENRESLQIDIDLGGLTDVELPAID